MGALWHTPNEGQAKTTYSLVVSWTQIAMSMIWHRSLKLTETENIHFHNGNI